MEVATETYTKRNFYANFELSMRRRGKAEYYDKSSVKFHSPSFLIELKRNRAGKIISF